ncbi:MAG: NAD-dependent epimerase/dehydratase family protein [Terracidiphilus sp.]
MKKILVIGGRGFLGRNLMARLSEREDCVTQIFDQGDSQLDLAHWLAEADLVFHLAGINRASDPVQFETGNLGFTEQICTIIRDAKRAPKIVFSSSIQAALNNPYGTSKAKAENALRQFASESGACVRIYRLKNLFGKWCKPDYNSVTATFCHNIARDLPIAVSDPRSEIRLSYVDDVVEAFLSEFDDCQRESEAGELIPSFNIQLGDLAGRIQAFHAMKDTLIIPNVKDWFNRSLYATYLSYVPARDREKRLNARCDDRGSLAEFAKQDHFGQVFVSRTRPGGTRGNHYHHTKTEKFLVVEGNGLIRMRAIGSETVEEYMVAGDAYQVIDIPPGVTHSITNVGDREMVTLFWASEIFDPDRTDTYYLPVEVEESKRTAMETA